MRFSQTMLAALITLGLCLPATGNIFTINFETDLSQTALDLDNGPTIDTISVANPLTVNVAEDPAELLTLSVIGAASFDPTDSAINTTEAGLGVNSPSPPGFTDSEEPARFDVDSDESATFAFNFDVTLISVEFTNLSGSEEIVAGGFVVNDGNSSGSDVFNFPGEGVFLTAGTGFTLEGSGPVGSDVGLEALTVEFIPPTSSIPEPTSVALLGLVGLGLVARRRR